MATEIVCAECGTTNQAGEDFCGECGAYLEWDGRSVEPTPEPEPVPEPVVEEAPRTVVERVKAAVGIGTDDETPIEKEKAEAQPAAEPAVEKTAPTVAAVLPGTAAPKARKRTAAPLDKPLQPGDLVCGSCGAGNTPSRKFCRRCGHDLAEAEVAKIPWWRRILPRRGPRTKVAGTRPRQRRRSRLPSYGRVIVVLALIAGVLYLTKPLWTSAYERVLDQVKTPVPINATSSRASSRSPGHAAIRARDGFDNTSWQVANAGPARGQWLEMGFDEPVRVVTLLITPGVGDKTGAYLANGRPAKLRITMFRKGAEAKSKEVTFTDQAGAKQVNFAVADVTRVRLTILKARFGNNPRSHVAISEVEFRGRT